MKHDKSEGWPESLACGANIKTSVAKITYDSYVGLTHAIMILSILM